MKFLLNLILLCIISSSCHYAEDDNYDSPAELTATWKLTQTVSEGNIIIANDDQYNVLTLNVDNTFTKTIYNLEGSTTITGTYSVTGDELSMISVNDTTVAEIVHLSSTALALQLDHDINNDGEDESVRKSYIKQ